MAARTISRSCLQSSQTAPAARIFLQLAFHRPRPVLDFLAPGVSNAAGPLSLRPIPKTGPRAFSTTTALKETVAIYNPRKDDDGQDMSVEITPRASNRLREIMAKDENPNLALRITVESGGCHGFQYLMSLTTLPPLSPSSTSASAPQGSGAPALNTSSSDPNAMPSGSPTSSSSSSAAAQSGEEGAETNFVEEDDTVFKTLDGSEAKVVMDGPSLELLKGSKIDYTMELIGSQFKIVDNPLATSSCGCGTSFDIKA